MQLVRITALPSLAANPGKQSFSITPVDLTPENEPPKVVNATWLAINQVMGALRLGKREILHLRVTKPLLGFDALIAATVGQFLGKYCPRHDLALSLPDTPPDASHFVGDPDFLALVQQMLATGKVPKVEKRHSQILELCKRIEALAKGAEENTPLAIGPSSMHAATAMAAGWAMGSMFPAHPLALRHGDSDVVCFQRVIAAPASLLHA